ncbi:hypothetical protein GCM10011491_06000 [Brucella endophytica]|uniref:DUF3368 domain-containing protein n=1 Tax=Brucella endophytica TaxID=1963359 RepID=A0A916WAZ6_9HYPH|nr:DUF3368 domain-containing protein [Brucella endophytica]GGA81512.1 hypothetical protein GCM10011491_06000 [Brucella endophytica]
MKLVASDASPLIIFAKSNLIPLLTGMIDEVIVPETVYAECVADVAMPGARVIRIAAETGQIHVRADIVVPGIPGVNLAVLDAGEIAAIHMAVALQCPVLMDERLGRQTARRQGLTVIGSAGLLLAAKQRGLIPAIAPILDQWREAGYFLANNIAHAVLERAGET